MWKKLKDLKIRQTLLISAIKNLEKMFKNAIYGKDINNIDIKILEVPMYRYKRKNVAQKIKNFLLIICIIILVAVVTILLHNMYLGIDIYTPTTNDNIKTERLMATVDEAKEESKEIVDLIEEATLSVVGISKIKNNGATIFNQNSTTELGLGTGVIISENGYILTNWHVAGNKYSNCYVTIENGKTYTGNVIWADSDLDLAIVKISAKGLSPIKLGDSENSRIGETVYAIGNPIGLEFQKTVTGGIISAVDRTIKIQEEDKLSYMEDLIQTDASINEGNSGGPLINLDGEMIGINTIKINDATGIGFAVPINPIKPIIEKLLQTERFEEAYIGIYGYDKEAIPYLNSDLSLDTGIYVAQINLDGPCNNSGLLLGDVITKIDNTTLNKMSELRNYIYTKSPGDKVILTIMRGKSETTIEITLGSR